MKFIKKRKDYYIFSKISLVHCKIKKIIYEGEFCFMLKKFLALIVFVSVSCTFAETYADLIPGRLEIKKENFNLSPTVKVIKIDMASNKITLEVTNRNKNVEKFTYKIFKGSDEEIISVGGDDFISEATKTITFGYSDLQNDSPRALIIEISEIETNVSTRYGNKRYRNSPSRNHKYFLEFYRDSDKNLTADVFSYDR